MAIPDYQSLMLPALRLCATGEIRMEDLVSKLAQDLELSPEERAQQISRSRQTVFANRICWATIHLNKAGLLAKPQPRCLAITDTGRSILSQNPLRIDNEFLTQFEAFRAYRHGAVHPATRGDNSEGPRTAPDGETPDETMRAAHRQIEASLEQDLLDHVRDAPPQLFERLIVDLLLKMGFGRSLAGAGRAIGRGGDDGVDGVIDEDALGLDRLYIQAKRYAEGNNIGAGAVRDFFGSLDRHKAVKGVFVTTSEFSANARQTADFLSKRIVLIDGQQLAALMIRHDVGCRSQDTLHIKKIDEDYFK
ncbi:MAG: restriction endonuclease [Acetobacteraceae bacterium]|nr:restriction endonuclease [Acetobacteraceae bacterium]